MTSFVLVPGAGGAGGYWNPVAERIRQHGHTAVPIDLPGPDPDAGLLEYVEIIRAALRTAGPDTVLVAQSMGGMSAAWAATLEPVRELVLLNAMIPAPGESAGQWWASTGQGQAWADAERAAGRDPEGGIDLSVHFLHDVPLQALAGLGEERDEAEIGFEQPFGPSTLPDVLIRVLVGADDRLFPPDFQERVAWQRLGQDVERVPGGHLAALAFPDEVAQAVMSGVEEAS